MALGSFYNRSALPGFAPSTGGPSGIGLYPNRFTIQNFGAPAPRHRLGLWLSYRKLISSAFVPNRWLREKLHGGTPKWLAMAYSLAAQQTGQVQDVAPGNFVVLAIMATSAQPEGIQVLLYDPRRKRQLTAYPLAFPRLAGDSKHPFVLKRPYPLAPKTPFLAAITNLSTLANNGYIVVYGVILPQGVELGSPDMASDESETAPPKRTYIEKPPWIERPASAEPFTPAASVALPAIGATATIVQFTVPTGRSGAIKWIGNQFIGVWQEGSGSLVWQLLVNGAAVRNFENIVMSLGAVNNPSEISPVRLRENDLIQLTITNVNLPVAGQLVLGRLAGWFYPKELDPENLT